MSMDRNWIYGTRISATFIQGVDEFIKFVVGYQLRNGSKLVLCPCCDCNNSRGIVM